MRTTIGTPIKAGRLPPEVRGDIPPEAVVRVSLELILDENGLTAAEADELHQAIEEAERGEGLSPAFHTPEEAIAYLRNDKTASGEGSYRVPGWCVPGGP